MDLATRDVDTVFAELICADAQWLREEFDALIAASFGQPPVAPPPAPPRALPPRGHTGPPSRGRPQPGPAAITPPLAAPTRRCQRSPPA